MMKVKMKMMWRKKRKQNALYENKQVLIFVQFRIISQRVSFGDYYTNLIAFRFIEQNYSSTQG